MAVVCVLSSIIKYKKKKNLQHSLNIKNGVFNHTFPVQGFFAHLVECEGKRKISCGAQH